MATIEQRADTVKQNFAGQLDKVRKQTIPQLQIDVVSEIAAFNSAILDQLHSVDPESCFLMIDMPLLLVRPEVQVGSVSLLNCSALSG